MIYIYTLGFAFAYLVGMVLFTRFAKRKLDWFCWDDDPVETLGVLIYPVVIAFILVWHILYFIFSSKPSIAFFKVIGKVFQFFWSISFGWALKEEDKNE